MNNNQNGNNGLNFMPTPMSNSNQNLGINNSSEIPGANLVPIGGSPTVNNSVPMEPTPISAVSIIDNNSNITASSEILNSTVNNGSVVPAVSNPNPVMSESSSVIPQITNSVESNLGLSNGGTGTFDIGLSNSSLDVGLNNSVVNQTNLQANSVNNVMPEMQMQGFNSTVNNNSVSEMSNVNSVPLTNTNPSYQTNGNDNIVSVGRYLGHIVLFSIPLIGLVMLIVKAFSDKKDKNISNFAKAQLLLSFIVVVIFTVIIVVFGESIFSMLEKII